MIALTSPCTVRCYLLRTHILLLNQLARLVVNWPVNSVGNNVAMGARDLGFVPWDDESGHSVNIPAIFARGGNFDFSTGPWTADLTAVKIILQKK